jgi:hypothetical protein
MSFEFFRRYVYKKGFLDGTIGFVSAIYQALHQAIIFTYLWEIQNNTKQKFDQEKKIVTNNK